VGLGFMLTEKKLSNVSCVHASRGSGVAFTDRNSATSFKSSMVSHSVSLRAHGGDRFL
jgi:hypothetical protein